MIEINPKLVENPSLITSSPEDLGYICVLMPKLLDIPKMFETLLDSEQYRLAVEERDRQASATVEEVAMNTMVES